MQTYLKKKKIVERKIINPNCSRNSCVDGNITKYYFHYKVIIRSDK